MLAFPENSVFGVLSFHTPCLPPTLLRACVLCLVDFAVVSCAQSVFRFLNLQIVGREARPRLSLGLQLRLLSQHPRVLSGEAWQGT